MRLKSAETRLGGLILLNVGFLCFLFAISRMRLSYLILLIVMNFFWAGSLSIYKALADYLEPGGIVTLRFGLAAVILAAAWPWLPGQGAARRGFVENRIDGPDCFHARPSRAGLCQQTQHRRQLLRPHGHGTHPDFRRRRHFSARTHRSAPLDGICAWECWAWPSSTAFCSAMSTGPA